MEVNAVGFLGEFWPWLSTLTIYVIDRFLGGWLDWLFLPYFDFRKYTWISFLLLYIILPAIFVLYIYLSVLSVYIFRIRHDIIPLIREPNGVIQRLKNFVTTCWIGHAYIWHSYEVHGSSHLIDLQNKKKGCMLVYYHGAVPVDVYYLTCWLQVKKKIFARPVVDYFMFKVPGFKTFLEVFGCTTGPRSRLVELLKDGNVVIVSPGGVREALFSKDYGIIWEDRAGFAKCAVEAQVPILPMFTSNVRQVFDFPDRMKGNTLRRLYEYTRLPFSLLFGFFPAKLDTYIGEPISTDGITVAECRDRAKAAVEQLIKKHQRYRHDWWKGLGHALKARITDDKK